MHKETAMRIWRVLMAFLSVSVLVSLASAIA